jgi:hypothetical protein
MRFYEDDLGHSPLHFTGRAIQQRLMLLKSMAEFEDIVA